jgi:hypothetical protein
MAVESAADLASFFHTDEFAVVVEWSRGGGWNPVNVDAVSSSPLRDVELGDEPALKLTQRMLSVQVSQLPTGYGKGDIVKLAGENWEVAERPELDETRTVASVVLRRR